MTKGMVEHFIFEMKHSRPGPRCYCRSTHSRCQQGTCNSLTSWQLMVDLICELKPGRKVYAISNMSAPKRAVLRTKPSDWNIF
jgi:hypothetical protein